MPLERLDVTDTVLRARVRPREVLAALATAAASGVATVAAGHVGRPLVRVVSLPGVAALGLVVVVLRSQLLLGEHRLGVRRVGYDLVVPWSGVVAVENRRVWGETRGLVVRGELRSWRRGSRTSSGFPDDYLDVSRFDSGFPESGPVVEALRRHRPDLVL